MYAIRKTKLHKFMHQTRSVDILDKMGDFFGMAKTNKVQLRCYIGPDERESLMALTTDTGLTETWILSQLVTSGLKAIRANGGVFPLPLNLQLVSQSDPKPGKK